MMVTIKFNYKYYNRPIYIRKDGNKPVKKLKL